MLNTTQDPNALSILVESKGLDTGNDFIDASINNEIDQEP